MNRTKHIQSIPATGLSARGIGSCFDGDVCLHRTSAQTDAAATK
jgi:hypothetical protein